VSLNYDNRSGLLGVDGFQRSSQEAARHKIEWIREGAGDRIDELEIEIGAYFTVITNDSASVAEQMSAMFGVAPIDVMAHPHVLIGSIGRICEELDRRREIFGISYVGVDANLAKEFSPVVERLAGK
jgi:hypothetical protein